MSVISMVIENQSRDGNCRNMMLFSSSVVNHPAAPHNAAVSSSSSPVTHSIGGQGNGGGGTGNKMIGPQDQHRIPIDVNAYHREALRELRQSHTNVPYVQLQARVVRTIENKGTFMSRCAAYTGDLLDRQIEDSRTMTKLGNYLNAVNLPLVHFRECMQEPQRHIVSATHEVVSMYMIIVQFVIMDVIVRFVPRLRSGLWTFLNRMRMDSPHHGQAPSYQRVMYDSDEDTMMADSSSGSAAAHENPVNTIQQRQTANTRPISATARTMYQRLLYFKSSITEYQGQQKRMIPEGVKRDVESHMRMNNLVDTKASTRRAMYRAVTCDATYNALKETDSLDHVMPPFRHASVCFVVNLFVFKARKKEPNPKSP